MYISDFLDFYHEELLTYSLSYIVIFATSMKSETLKVEKWGVMMLIHIVKQSTRVHVKPVIG